MTHPAPAVPGPQPDGEYFDRTGTRIGLEEFRRLRADHGYRLLRRDQVADWAVITVWLGRDQGPFADQDQPLIFGTVARAADGALLEDREWFTATEAEALDQHEQLRARLRTPAATRG